MPARQLARPPATTRPARGPLHGHRRPPLEADVARLPVQVGRPGGLDRARATEPAERDCAGGLVVRGGSAARGLLVVGRAVAGGEDESALPVGGLGFCFRFRFRFLLPAAAEARRWGVGLGLGGPAVDGDVGGARGWLGGGEGFVVGGTGFVFPEAVEGVGARGWLRLVGGGVADGEVEGAGWWAVSGWAEGWSVCGWVGEDVVVVVVVVGRHCLLRGVAAVLVGLFCFRRKR